MNSGAKQALERAIERVDALINEASLSESNFAADALVLLFNLANDLALVADREAELKRRERKVEAYDRARARVKIEGATRAEYVLRAEAAEERGERLEAAAREYVRAKDDRSWSATKDWHKRHDINRAEAELRAALSAVSPSGQLDAQEGES